jgi:hypothetical protein
MRRIVIAAALAALVLLAGRAQVEPAESPRKSALPVLLNILPGFGLGSFVQGDRTGGFLGLAGEVAGCALLVVGAGMGYANLLGLMFSGMSGETNGASEPGMEAGKWMAIGGCALWAGTKIYEIVRPFAFARRGPAERAPTAWLAPALVPASGGNLPAPALVLLLAY